MSDIVERLRSAEPCGIDRCREMSIRGGCLCEIAADEIERLRVELEAARVFGGGWFGESVKEGVRDLYRNEARAALAKADRREG